MPSSSARRRRSTTAPITPPRPRAFEQPPLGAPDRCLERRLAGNLRAQLEDAADARLVEIADRRIDVAHVGAAENQAGRGDRQWHTAIERAVGAVADELARQNAGDPHPALGVDLEAVAAMWAVGIV